MAKDFKNTIKAVSTVVNGTELNDRIYGTDGDDTITDVKGFNELIGGFKNAYGDYESDYYFNSLKATADYLKNDTKINNGKPTIIATNHSSIMQHYFRNYPNVTIIYSKSS